MCDPHFYRVSYEINPWMKVENQPSNSLAIEQWNKLVDLLRSLGATVEVMQGKASVPDIVFTANAALIYKNKAYLSKFFHPERRPETQLYEVWFKQNGFETVTVKNFFEGAGDALFSYNHHRDSSDQLYAGWGFRSNQMSLYEDDEVRLHLSHMTIHSLNLVDPYFYHLDTCFCPLKDGFTLVYLPAFSQSSADKIRNSMDYISVCEEDAKKFACNAVCLGNKVVMPSGCENTYRQLENLGYEVYHTDVSEFIKAGGACKCLTLRLDEFQ
jgi:N-dimethylarginine dimethylaminohydrolase